MTLGGDTACLTPTAGPGAGRAGEHDEREVAAGVGDTTEDAQRRGRGDHLQLLGWLWTPENCHHEEGQQHLSVPVQSS